MKHRFFSEQYKLNELTMSQYFVYPYPYIKKKKAGFLPSIQREFKTRGINF